MKVVLPRLEVITGPMFCGKTEELIRRIQRLQIAGYKIQVFKPALDDRYGVDFICAHTGAKVKCYSLSGIRDLLENIDESADGYAFDEVHFLEAGVMKVILNLLNKGKIVLASGLNQDFTGKPFRFKDSDRHMGELMALADEIIHLNAICTHKEGNGVCSAMATRSQRLVDGKSAKKSDPLILVGGKESYEARCTKHHFVEDE